MTEVAVDWLRLSTPEFVAWTRWQQVALPYPLSSGDVPYLAAPEPAAIERTLASRKLADSPLLQATALAFSQPRLLVYAVRVTPDAGETKSVAIASHEEDRAVLLLLDAQQVAVRPVADTELAAGVVGTLPPLAPLVTDSVEVPVAGLQAVDRLIAAGASPRSIRAEMLHVGLPEALIAAQETTPPGPLSTGFLAAVGYGADGDTGSGRHARRSASWREFPAGALLQLERTDRHGEPVALLTPFTPEAAFRAAADAVASLYDQS